MVSSQMNLRKFVVPEFVFGEEARFLVGRYAKNLGARKILIVTDQGVLDSNWADQLIDMLKLNSLPFVVYSSVEPNPRDYNVMQGAELYKKEGCNFVIALGGGSSMDCAKGIGIVVSNGGHILSYEGVDRIDYPCPPLICLPTTCGSSADVSQFTIIRNSQKSTKISIISKAVVPDLALIDAQMLQTMPKHLLACTGMDALTHAIEAYVSNARSEITSLHALEAIRLISKFLPIAYHDDNNTEALKNLMLGSLYAGLAFSNASLGAVHAMAHSMGGKFDFAHGECNAILLEHVIKLNFPYVPALYSDIAVAMGLFDVYANQNQETLLERISSLRQSLGIADFYTVDNLTDDMMESLVENSLKDACIVTNPVMPKKQELKAIYGKVLASDR